MSTIGPAKIKAIKNDGNQGQIVFRVAAACSAFCELRENINLGAIRVRGADLDSDILMLSRRWQARQWRMCRGRAYALFDNVCQVDRRFELDDSRPVGSR